LNGKITFGHLPQTGSYNNSWEVRLQQLTPTKTNFINELLNNLKQL